MSDSPRYSEHRYLWRGEEVRVVVVGDILALPGSAGRPGWSMGGFGPSISIEWLLHEGGLPGPKARRVALADMLSRSLAQHHEGGDASGDGRDKARGPFARCQACKDSGVSGFVLVRK